MAIYHLTVQVLGRSSNHKAVAAAAYRAGERLHDDRYGMEHDYRRKTGIVHAEIMAPEAAPDWVGDRESLWNRVEKGEKRRDAQVAREIEMAIPRELSDEDRLKLVRDFVSHETVDRGMIADFAIHQRGSTDGGGNPHAHVMLTMRRVTPEGFERTKARDWNDDELVVHWRKQWEIYCNEALEAAGFDARVDCRTLEEQGILREATIHMGKEAFHAQEKGEQVEDGRAQLSMVELATLPFDRQIETSGHIDMMITPEAGEGWWEKACSYTNRATEAAQELYGWARDKVQGWRGLIEQSDVGPKMER